MEAMRQSWTDDRLDDFRGEVNRRFDEVDRRFDEAREETGRRFDEASAQVDQRFKEASEQVDQRFDEVYWRLEIGSAESNRRLDEVNRRFERLENSFDAMQRTIVLTGSGMLAALVTGVISLIGIAVF